MCKEGIKLGRRTQVKGVVTAAGAGNTITAIDPPDPDRIAATLGFGSPVVAAGDVALLQANVAGGWVTIAAISPDHGSDEANVEWWGQLLTAELRINVQSAAGIAVTVGLVRVTQPLSEL